MFYHVIASGSKGNSTLIKSKNTIILIDMGITLKRLQSSLDTININIKDIDAVLFTHNHADHYGELKFFSPKKQYALERTLPSSLSNVVKLWRPFVIKDLTITPILTIHDASNPCGYFISDGEESLAFITDTGYVPDETIDVIKNPTYLLIESNHDVRMLLATSRPQKLKDRIMSDFGHLSNEDSALAALKIVGDNTKEIVLSHLSEEANTPEVAIKAYKKMFKYFNVDILQFLLKTANQNHSISGGKL